MKYSKDKMIKWLEKRIETTRRLTNYFESKGDLAAAGQYRMETLSIQNIIWMMTDNEHFERQYKVYFKENEK